MREEDRITEWVDRYSRWELAYLVAKGLLQPEKLTGEERQTILDEAAGSSALSIEEIRDRGIALAADIMRSKVVQVS